MTSRECLLSAREFAAAVKVTHGTVVRWARQKRIYSVRVVDELRIPSWVLDDFCARPREMPAPTPRSQETFDREQFERDWQRFMEGDRKATRGAGHANGTKRQEKASRRG